MSSEIQFGDVEQNEPQQAVRPDRDAHYCIATVGDINPDDLPIYVDLDVLRDMEAHAHTNTRVELGGVMLGKQCIDADGKPFVTVTNSLRARHYEATRGSFKFTHETWSQITGERNQFHPDLEMVGWYHTHPGWTVFLSPMDLFICNNFFNRNLDVALVIDPCNDDRGWFQWDENHQTQRTGGFYLTSIRYREQELNHFASLYNHEPPMNSDPRYSGYHISAPSVQGNDMDNRKLWFDLLIVSMLMMQLFFMGFMMMRFGGGPAENAVAEGQEDKAAEVAEASRSLEERPLKLALDALAESTGREEVAEKLVSLETDRQQLSESLKGQVARIQVLELEKNALEKDFVAQGRKSKALADKVIDLEKKLEKEKESSGDSSEESDAESPSKYGFAWLFGSGLAGVILGAAAVLLLRRDDRDGPDIEVDAHESELKFATTESTQEQ